MIIGDDQKGFEEGIQRVIQQAQNKEDIFSEFKPVEMQYGRETDLNIANIAIDEPLEDGDKDAYKYLIDKKLEELSRDRLEQFKKIAQNEPQDYSIETYIKKYEEQTGTKLTESQIQGVKAFDRKIQNDLILGRYSLEEYINFLKSIPDLLSGKKILGVGHFDPNGRFYRGSEIDEPQSAEDISRYTTYTYIKTKELAPWSKDNFKVMSLSPSIKKRMTQGEDRIADQLCVIDVTKEHEFLSPEEQKSVIGHPDMKYIGKGLMYSIFLDNGILVAGKERQTTKENSTLSADDISDALQEISRKGLTADVQKQLIAQADNQANKEPKKISEEQL